MSRKATGTPVWGTAAVGAPIRISTSCAGVGPMLAAEQFLPPRKLEVVSLADTAFAAPSLGRSALRLTKKNVKAQHICANIAAPAKGKVHCKVQHKDVKEPPEEDIPWSPVAPRPS